MNKYHNRNRIFSPIMTIHDILTLHIQIYSLSSFLSLPLSSLFPSFLPSLLLSSLFPFFLSLPSLLLSLSVFSVFYREGRRLSHHPDIERYCARLSE